MRIGDIISGLFKSSPVAAEPPVHNSGEVGWSESLLYANSDWPKYNPDDLLRRKGHKLYRQMMIDEQVKAVVKFKRDAITSREYYFHYDKRDREQEVRAEVLTYCLKKLPGSFIDSINGIMSAMYSGFSMSEKVFQLIQYEGKSWVGLKRLALKPFESFWFNTDEFGNIQSTTQKWEGREQDIDMNKFVHHVINPDYDPHYGQSDLREAYRPYFSKDIIIRMHNIFLERCASGFMWASATEGTDLRPGTQVYNDLKAVLQNVQTKTAIIMPAGVTLNFELPKSNPAYESAIAMHDKAIAKSQLVPNLLGITEQGSVGAYSQSQTQLEAFLWTLDAEALRLEETINEQLIKDLGDLNWGDGNYPEFKFKPVSESTKHKIIGVWKDLVTAGAVQHTDTDEAYIRELLEFPEAGEPVNSTSNADIGTDSEDPASGDTIVDVDKADLPDETIVGKGSLSASKKLALSRAIKRVDFAVIEKNTDTLVVNTMERARSAIELAVATIKQTIQKEDVLNTSNVEAVRVPASAKSELKIAAQRMLQEAWRIGAKHGVKEVEKARGKRFAVDNINVAQKAADKFLESRAFTLSGDVSANLEKKVTTIMYNGIKGSWTLQEIYDAIDDELGSVLMPQLQTAIRTTLFEAINEARYEVFTDPQLEGFVEALEYSAILDGRTTEICESLDGHTHSIDSDFWDTYRPPNHFNCRSLIVPVTELDNWKESKQPKVDPAEGFS